MVVQKVFLGQDAECAVNFSHTWAILRLALKIFMTPHTVVNVH